MLDPLARRWIDPPLNQLGQVMAQFTSANTLTLLGFFLGLGAVPALAYEAYGWALVFIVLNRLFDGLDGAVARHSQMTDFGGYLDIVCDFIFYAAVVFGFALARPENAIWSSLLLLGFMGTASTFLAHAILAAKHSAHTQSRGKKSFYYLGGLTEGSETLLFFFLICLFPDYFPAFAGVFSAMCALTALGRIMMTRASFGAPQN